MGDDANHFQAVHKGDSVLAGTFQSECHNAASAVWHIFRCEVVVAVAWKSAVFHPSHFRIILKVLCHFECIAAVTLNTKMQCFETYIEEESVLWRLNGPEIAHKLCSSLLNVSHFSERFGVGETVV